MTENRFEGGAGGCGNIDRGGFAPVNESILHHFRHPASTYYQIILVKHYGLARHLRLVPPFNWPGGLNSPPTITTRPSASTTGA
jgi:hypothetical protein